MTRGFDANVPARKPRTKISRVLSELTSGAVAAAEDGKGNGTPDLAVAAPAAGDASPAAPPRETPRVVSGGPGGRERIARLRERLAVTAHAPAGVAEPKRTAAAVRELIDALRGRGVHFVVCNNSMREQGVDFHKLYHVTDADIVPSGFLEVAFLQAHKHFVVDPSL